MQNQELRKLLEEEKSTVKTNPGMHTHKTGHFQCF